MFKKRKRRIPRFSILRTFNPSVIDDPLALQTEWTAANHSGANFRTHQLVSVNSDRLEFRATMGAFLCGAVFFLVGLGIVIGCSISGTPAGSDEETEMIAAIFVLGIPGMIAGVCINYFFMKPIVFDKQQGCLWKRWRQPAQGFQRKKLKDFAELEEIHALQLLSKPSDDHRDLFELNLVLQNGNRFHVVNSSDLETVRKDAATLSAFLEKPVWDATLPEQPEVG